MATSQSRKMGPKEMVVVMVMVVVMLLLPSSCVMGRKVSVASIKIEPYLIETRNFTTGKITYDGYIVDLLDRLGTELSMEFNIKTLADQYGKVEPATGRWSGLVGKVLNGEVEMVAAPLTITSERARVVDYSVPFQTLSGVIVLRHPDQASVPLMERIRFIFLPFEDSVWLAAGVTYLLTGLILYVICHVNPYEWRHLCKDHLATRREAESFTCLNTYWFLISTFMWQGFIRAPHSLGGRLVVFGWWVFVVVFLITYTSSLTNLLRAVPQADEVSPHTTGNTRILSLKDLEAQEPWDIDVSFVQGGATDAILRQTQTPYLKRLHERVLQSGSAVHSVEEGVQRVRQPKGSPRDVKPAAFITESTLARFLVRQTPCDLYMVPDTSIQGSYSLAFQINWDLKDSVDRALLGLQENGILMKLEHKWFQGPCSSHVLDSTLHLSSDDEPEFHQVNLGSFSGLLLILAAGVLLGAIVTVVEICVFRAAEKTSYDEPSQASKAQDSNLAPSEKGALAPSAV